MTYLPQQPVIQKLQFCKH